MAKYLASFNSREVTIETSDGLYAAKQRAIEIFKPRKNESYKVIVVLTHRDDGSEVSHSTAAF